MCAIFSVRNLEVRGSIPLCSTIEFKKLYKNGRRFCTAFSLPYVRSEHRIIVFGFFRDVLDDIPMFYYLAVLDTEDIHGGLAPVLGV